MHGYTNGHWRSQKGLGGLEALAPPSKKQRKGRKGEKEKIILRVDTPGPILVLCFRTEPLPYPKSWLRARKRQQLKENLFALIC